MKTRKTNANRSHGLLLVLASQALGALLLLQGCTLDVEGGETDPGFDDVFGGVDASSEPPKFFSGGAASRKTSSLEADAEPHQVDAGSEDSGSAPDAALIDGGDAAQPARDAGADACIPFYNC